ncbi:basic salivary proline-rich protein 1-like [Enhydra lutris kenyoni]|uniref:Basic salivary proline-rich protein 1-like n=1 Tax=Enhydra lutris kenyoni TaxID=391180 RepID=A0A2Y9K9L0_ENHLU|nr:basic salivary proline-rich protein 1-like [Enhydra lutris kenyoni]
MTRVKAHIQGPKALDAPTHTPNDACFTHRHQWRAEYTYRLGPNKTLQAPPALHSPRGPAPSHPQPRPLLPADPPPGPPAHRARPQGPLQLAAEGEPTGRPGHQTLGPLVPETHKRRPRTPRPRGPKHRPQTPARGPQSLRPSEFETLERGPQTLRPSITYTPDPRDPSTDPKPAGPPGTPVNQRGAQTRGPKVPATKSQEPTSPLQGQGANNPPEGPRDAPQRKAKAAESDGHASSPRGPHLKGAHNAKQERHRPRAATPARRGARAFIVKPTSRKHEAATHGPALSQRTVREPGPRAREPAQAHFLRRAASTDAGSCCRGGSGRLSAPPPRRDLANDLGQVPPKPEGPAGGRPPPSGLRVGCSFPPFCALCARLNP